MIFSSTAANAQEVIIGTTNYIEYQLEILGVIILAFQCALN
jgi:hypothetical protein